MARNMLTKIISAPAIFVIKCYKKLLSPLLPPSCRFHPSCSSYGLLAYQQHPFFKASRLTAWRILRCNPFNPGGYDPVPPPFGEAPGVLAEEKGKL